MVGKELDSIEQFSAESLRQPVAVDHRCQFGIKLIDTPLVFETPRPEPEVVPQIARRLQEYYEVPFHVITDSLI